ncbi:MAG: glycoside hydrolase family 97 protein [Chitinophagaceae bacterium]|nr:glycoside hydrolase family 97 protein [Chitinophagaceae bacterium]
MYFKKIAFAVIFLSAAAFSLAQTKTTVKSPNKNIELNFWLNDKGAPMYSVSYKSREVLLPSAMGFELKQTMSNEALPALKDNLVVTSSTQTSSNTKWKPVWGDVKEISDNYSQLKVSLSQKGDKAISFNIIFKVFDDGVGFRYEFPEQKNLAHFIVSEEKTEFHLAGDHKAFWIPGDFDSNEFNPNVTKLSEVNGEDPKYAANIFAHQFFDKDAVQTPLMLKTNDGLYINIHEAALVNYPAMNLHIDKSNFNLSSVLVPDALGNKAYLQAPAKTPWRTIIISDKATDMLASHTILNLNDPSVIKDPSWIKPTKYVGVWWEMHVGKATWDYAGSQNATSFDAAGLKPTGKHGANTANVKRYIDFAAKHGFAGVLVEGWNTGWEDWFGQYKENVFDFVTPYPDFDVKGLHKYAASKNVKLIMHHETSASVTNYERQMDTAYRFMKANGYDAVKTGYVGHIIPRGEHHDGQWMVNHYVRVAQKTASYKIMLDAHEPVRPTGLSRTYPNWLACEAARGMEFNAWSEGNRPNHDVILPFTRFMGGPMDYTPGIFQLDLSYWDKNKKETIHTTLAKQLALYVTICSPLQMAADLPESYEKKMDAFQFIKDVAVDWDDSKYLEAEPGEYITVARKAKGSNNWFVGAITNENSRNADVNLDFLDAGKKYTAIIYADAADADYQKNPAAYIISKQVVDSKSVLNLKLAPGGGCAVSIMPVK